MKISDQAVLVFASKTLSGVLLFALGPILVRQLDQTQYGTFLQVNLTISLLVAILPCGIPQAISYFVPRIGTPRHFNFVARTLTILFVLGCFGAVVVWLGREFIGHWLNNPQLIMLAPYIGGLMVVTILSDTTEGIFYAYNRTIVIVAVLPLKAIARVVGAVLPLQFGRGLPGAFEGLIIVGLVESILLYGYHVMRRVKVVADSSGVSISEQVRYAWPVGLTMIVTILGTSMDKFVVSSLFTPAQYALYARGAFELPLVGMLSGMLAELLVPRYSEYFHKGQTVEIMRLIRESVRRISLVLYPFCMLCIILADPLIKLLFTDSYAASVPIFRVYVLLMLFQVASFPIVFRATGNNMPWLKVTVLRFLLGLALTVGLINLIGPIGGAIAVVLTQAIITVLAAVLVSYELNASWKQLVPWKDLWKTLALSACIAVAILPITWLAAPNWAILLLGGGVFGAIFVFCAFYLERISDSDKEILTRWAALVVRS